MRIPVREASKETFSAKNGFYRSYKLTIFCSCSFSGILGFDVLLDKNGDVQHNLTVIAFDGDIAGKI